MEEWKGENGRDRKRYSRSKKEEEEEEEEESPKGDRRDRGRKSSLIFMCFRVLRC